MGSWAKLNKILKDIWSHPPPKKKEGIQECKLIKAATEVNNSFAAFPIQTASPAIFFSSINELPGF